MVNVVLAYKGRNLDDVANELERHHPSVRRFKATNYGEALNHIYNQKPAAVLIDSSIENGLGIFREIKTIPELDVHTIYFVASRREINIGNPHVNQWYVRGSSPRAVVESIAHILTRQI